MEELKDYREIKPKERKHQLHVYVNDSNYERIKWAAKNRGMTISRFVMGVIMQQIIQDEQYK